MIIKFLSVLFLINSTCTDDSLDNFRNQLSRNIQLYIEPPPESLSGDSCYHHTELLKVEINRMSKVVKIDLSDSAPGWLKDDLNKQKRRNNIDLRKLDSLALKAGLRNCTLVFPLILESEDFPCGQAGKERKLKETYFHFGGKNLSGNTIFGEQIKFTWSVNYVRK